MLDSLWGAEIDSFIESATKKNTKAVLNKIKQPKTETKSTEKQLKSKVVPLSEKIKLISENVNAVLGKQKNNISVLYDKEQLLNYIDQSIRNGVIAIDTETNNSLDATTCKLMGLCLYTAGQKQVYVPVNHINNDTGERLSNQLTEKDCAEALKKVIESHIEIVMHNGKFDYQVLKCTCGVEVIPTWDTMLGAKIINENELAGLKQQYILHIDKDQEKYSIEHLFEKLPYEVFDPELFAMYAATDAMMTYKLYEYQRDILNSEENKKLKSLFLEVEMPCVQVVAEMELSGITVDLEYSKRLSEKYHKILDDVDARIKAELDKIQKKIAVWRLTPEANQKEKKLNKKGEETLSKSKAEQLEDPINLGSPAQLAILLYDILKVPPVDAKSGRGTGEDILKKMNLPICNLLLERRAVVKLLDAFIDTIPEVAKNWKDHRVRTHFNQYGADTGRFSSSSPLNLQQIPSHNKEIRMMFMAQEGYTLVGSDFSQQEPRLLSQLSGDENMTQAYKDGKDLYATIASGVYHNNYWDNMESYEDGSANPDGAVRRGNCKSLLLGIMYSRGVFSIADQIHGTKEEAQAIVDNFFGSFPKVKGAIDDSHYMAKTKGYVEDLWGRRRHLPDINLPKFEITDTLSKSSFNPLFGCVGRVKESDNVKRYQKLLNSAKTKAEVNDIIKTAQKLGLIVKDNSGLIAQAERQCLNARIQGSAATMTKIAMNKIFRDKELNKLGFKLLIGVHDELIGECPKENQDKVAERLCYVMKTCVEGVVNVPFKCDAAVCDHWYLDQMSYKLQKEYHEMLKMGLGESDAFHQLHNEHTELTNDQLREMLKFGV